jgi:hypothetical protein
MSLQVVAVRWMYACVENNDEAETLSSATARAAGEVSSLETSAERARDLRMQQLSPSSAWNEDENEGEDSFEFDDLPTHATRSSEAADDSFQLQFEL